MFGTSKRRAGHLNIQDAAESELFGCDVEAVEDRAAVVRGRASPRTPADRDTGRCGSALSEKKSPTSRDPAPTLTSANRAVERPVAKRADAGRLRLVEARLGDNVDDRGCSCRRIRRARTPVMISMACTASCGDLVGIDPALLIGHGLVVNGELRLRMIADGMEEAVRVGHDARRSQVIT